MDENDETLMAKFGITAQTKVVYHYDGHRYERLADAVNYAKTRQHLPKDADASHAVSGDRS